jgi:hypothetical protein
VLSGAAAFAIPKNCTGRYFVRALLPAAMAEDAMEVTAAPDAAGKKPDAAPAVPEPPADVLTLVRREGGAPSGRCVCCVARRAADARCARVLFCS